MLFLPDLIYTVFSVMQIHMEFQDVAFMPFNACVHIALFEKCHRHQEICPATYLELCLQLARTCCIKKIVLLQQFLCFVAVECYCVNRIVVKMKGIGPPSVEWYVNRIVIKMR